MRREIGIKKIEYLHGCNFRLEINFSNFRRNISSAPYFPWVPLSTSKKYAWRLFKTANFDLCIWSKRKKRKWSINRDEVNYVNCHQLKSNSFKRNSDNCVLSLCCTENWIGSIYRGELMLWHGTSRLWPNSSWFRSTIPHGAIPILTTRPVRCCPSNNNASPTCFVTPVKYTHKHASKLIKNNAYEQWAIRAHCNWYNLRYTNDESWHRQLAFWKEKILIYQILEI